MRQTIFIFINILFISSYSFGQLEKNDDEYLFQTYSIFEITVLNELIKLSNEFDSIKLIEGKTIYTVDSTWKVLPFPSEYSVNYNRRHHKIKTIKTTLVSAHFTYNIYGKVSKIKYEYSRKARYPLYEGTTDYYEFEYDNEKLIKCYDYGIYSKNHPEIYTIKYY